MASMAAKISECVEEQQQGPPTAVVQSTQGYDFAEQPSEDFFCPVTFELLTDPHLTVCCGSHLSQDAVIRLQGDSKPCPMCKHEQLTTVLDKNMQRKVSALKVQCHHKQSGCEWVGEISYLNGHLQSCPKRPWSCCYCQFESTYDIGMKEHVDNCTKYPIVCPNSCGVEKVLRCDLDAHLEVCPLQIVACLYAEFGCDIKVPRKDLSRHLDEEQQQHQFSATLLNVQLTKELLSAQKTEMVRESLAKEVDQVRQDLERQLAEKELAIIERDKKIAEKEKQLKDKDHEIAAKDKELRLVLARKEKQLQVEIAAKDKELRLVLARKEKQLQDEIAAKDKELRLVVAKKEKQIQSEIAAKDKELASKDEQVSKLKRQVSELQNEGEMNAKQEARRLIDEGFTPRSFSVTSLSRASVCEAFYVQGYRINLRTERSSCRNYVCVDLIIQRDCHGKELHWPVSCKIHLGITDEYGIQLDFLSSVAQFIKPIYSPNVIRVPMHKFDRKDRDKMKPLVLTHDGQRCLDFQVYIKIEKLCQ